MATLGVIGDFWTLGILRCSALGFRRFGHFQSELGVATNVLSDRLGRLVDAGVLERVRYQDRPVRHEYVPTAEGLELWPVVMALKNWGDRHLQPDGAWSLVSHRGCPSPLEVAVVCPDCGAMPDASEIETVVLRPS